MDALVDLTGGVADRHDISDITAENSGNLLLYKNLIQNSAENSSIITASIKVCLYLTLYFLPRVILLILVSYPEIRFLRRRFDVEGVWGLWGGTCRVFWGLGSIYKQKNNPGNINIIFSFFFIQKMDTLQQGDVLYKMEQITLTMKNSGGGSS